MKIKRENIILPSIAFLALSFFLLGNFRHQYISDHYSPITCEIVKIRCKSSIKNNSKCDIIYNGKLYTGIDLTKKCKEYKTGINNTDFYYDAILDSVFCKGIINNHMIIVFSVFFLLSLIPLTGSISNLAIKK